MSSHTTARAHSHVGLGQPDASTVVPMRARFFSSAALASNGRLTETALAAAIKNPRFMSVPPDVTLFARPRVVCQVKVYKRPPVREPWPRLWRTPAPSLVLPPDETRDAGYVRHRPQDRAEVARRGRGHVVQGA